MKEGKGRGKSTSLTMRGRKQARKGIVLEPKSLIGSRQDAGTLNEGLVQSSAIKEKAVEHVIS